MKEDNTFKRKGDDLIYNLNLNIAEASLGCQKEIPLINDKTKTVKIHPGVQPGEEIRIRGEGVRNSETGRKGDLVIKINIEIPKRLTREQKKLLLELKKTFEAKRGFHI